ncbi:hypothetical protein V2J09_009712 [Rumex salicifolius]
MELNNALMPKRSRKKRNLHEQLVEENAKSETMIEIWKHFPEDLLEVVLTWLPAIVLLRYRIVSKRWNSLLISLDFRQRWRNTETAKKPWFFVKDGGMGPGSLYNPFTKKWLHSTWTPLPTLNCMYPLTFAGGLVCYLNYESTFFYVGNPFSRRWKGLPCNDSAIIKKMTLGSIAIGMVTVPDKDALTSTWRSKIVLVDNQGNYEVFTTSNDITCESPMITGKIPSDIKVPSYFSPSAYRITWKMENGHKISSQHLLTPLTLPFTECNGHLFLTGAAMDANTSTISVRVWKRVMVIWMEIDCMPSSLCSEFEGKADIFYECLCNKNVIMFLLKTSRMTRLYTYDLMSREWSKVPKLSFPNQRRKMITGGIWFFPSLAMP